MQKMILLFSHTLSDAQKNNAKEIWGIETFVALPDKLQAIWSNIPPELEDIESYLEEIKNFLSNNVDKDDIVLIQGDFGATYSMILFVKTLGIEAIYATTKREVKEKEIDGKMVKTSVFEHIRFRRY